MRLVLILLAFGSFLSGVLPPAASAAEKIRVLTRDIEPFSFERDGRRVGYSMELWDAIARQSGLEYELVRVNSAQEMIDALKDKRGDAAVAALSVTAAREEIVDFSQPFYESGLQILAKGAEGGFFSSARQILTGLFSWQLIGVLLGLVGLMFVVSHFLWRYEHGANAEMFPASYRQGVWESFWWTTSVLLVGGAENKAPIGVGGRLVAILWMLLSIVLVAFLTATFTTTLTVNTLRGEISGPGDLPGRTVATIGGSTSEAWLKGKKITAKPFPTVAACTAALKAGEAQAVVYDAPMLLYALNQAKDSDLQLVGSVFERQSYAIALQQNSPLRKRINLALLQVTEQGLREELRKKWFGAEN